MRGIGGQKWPCFILTGLHASACISDEMILFLSKALSYRTMIAGRTLMPKYQSSNICLVAADITL